MSRIDERHPGTPLSEGRPIDPDIIVPDGDAEMSDDKEPTETERADRRDAALPNGGLSEDYDDQDVDEPAPEDGPADATRTRGS